MDFFKSLFLLGKDDYCVNANEAKITSDAFILLGFQPCISQVMQN